MILSIAENPSGWFPLGTKRDTTEASSCSHNVAQTEEETELHLLLASLILLSKGAHLASANREMSFGK